MVVSFLHFHRARVRGGVVRERAHQSQIAAAVEQRVAAAGDGAAEGGGGFGEAGGAGMRRGAEDGDIHNTIP